ncbi:flippase [Methanopyrus sp.]
MPLLKLVKGSITVLVGSLFLRLGGYVYRLLVGRLLGPDGYGIVSSTMVIQTIVMFLATFGVPPAVARYVAKYHALGEGTKVRQFIVVPTLVLVALSTLAALILALAAPYLASWYFHNPRLYTPLLITAIGLPFAAFASCVRGVFQGFQDMRRYVLTQFVEQGTRVGGAPALILAGYGPTGAVFASATLAYATSGLYGAAKLRSEYLPKIPREDEPLPPNRVAKSALTFGLPVALTGIADMIQSNVDLLVIGYFLGTIWVGYYDAAGPIARLPTTLCAAVATALLPAASEAEALKDERTLRQYAHIAIKTMWTLLIPVAVLTGVLAGPLITLFFGPAFRPGAQALYVLPTAMAFIVVFRSCASLLQGIGRERLPLVVLSFSLVANVVLNAIMVPKWGIFGASVATAISNWLAMILIVRAVMVHAKTHLKLRWVLVPVITGVAAWFTTEWSMLLTHGSLLKLLLGSAVGALTYSILLVVLGGVSDLEWELLEKGARRVGSPGIVRVVRLARSLELLGRIKP